MITTRDLLRAIYSAQGQKEHVIAKEKIELVIGEVEDLPHQAFLAHSGEFLTTVRFEF